MRKLNKKAFTLIEILAAVTILGILSIVAIVAVNRIIQNTKDEQEMRVRDGLYKGSTADK